MTDLDALMDRDPTNMTNEDISALILMYRRQRAQTEGGKRPQKESGPKIELKDLGLVSAPKPVLRRV